MKKISTVTFDLWDTLIKEAPGNSDKVAQLRIERIASVLESGGHPHTREDVTEAYDRLGAFLEMTWGKARDMPVRDQVLFMLDCIECRLAGALTPDEFSAIENAYANSILDFPPGLLPNAKEAVQAIKDGGYRLGLISNTGKTPGTTLRIVMKDLGILGCFDVTTFSNEVLVRKPAKGMFKVTLEQLKVLPKAAVHIGDDPEKDVEAAKSVGMHAIQALSPETLRSPDADGHVSRLEDLLHAVERL